ncbi:MAG: hypothetical protein AAF960_03490 [Bacteroidota bacterium]
MKEIFDDLKNAIWKDDRILGLRQLAQREGFRFSERQRFGNQPIHLRQFSLFSGSQGKRVKGILQKKETQSGINRRIYDYVYFGDTRNKTTTVFEFYHPDWSFSSILIRPKGRLQRMKDFFNDKHLIFRQVTAFHKQYFIEPTASHLAFELNEGFLSALALERGIWVEMNQQYLLFYFKDELLPINGLKEKDGYFLEAIDQLVNGYSEEEFV